MQSATRTDPTSVLTHIDSGPDSTLTALSNTINNAFLAPNPPTATKLWVLKKLTSLNPAKALGPDSIPAWLLKENADLLAQVVTDLVSLTVHTRRRDYPSTGRKQILPLFPSRPLCMT